ncbi:MAG: SDR family oxidoreductase [Salibacteraceae bacterium]
MTFKNKVCWVTGASSGIGEALSFEMAKSGARLVLSARRLEQLNRVKDKCLSLGATDVLLIPIDLSNSDSINEGFKAFVEKYDSVDYLVNNGGISQRGLVKDTPVDIDRKVLEVNFFGAVTLTKLVLPMMLKKGSGNISATSSLVGKFGFPLRSAYSASKHAIQGFYESLRTEVQKDGVYISILIPGRVKTEISVNAVEADGSKHGKMDEGQDQGISSEKAARIIAKGLLKNKREIEVGGKELLMIQIRRFIPSLFYKIVARIKHT